MAGAHPNIPPECGHFISPSARCAARFQRVGVRGTAASFQCRDFSCLGFLRGVEGKGSQVTPAQLHRLLLGEGAGHAAQSQKGLPTAVRPPTPSVVHLPCGTTLASQGVLGFVFKEPDCGGFLRTILRSEALGKERTRQGGRQ